LQCLLSRMNTPFTIFYTIHNLEGEGGMDRNWALG
jgi:hypothetical protein